MGEQNENYQGISGSNNNYNNFNALQIRLGDTGVLINEIKNFLSGTEKIYEQKGDEIYEKLISIGEPKANTTGVYSILNYVRTIINSHVVQGNFMLDGMRNTSSAYDNYICDKRIELVFMLIVNQYKWEIRDKDIHNITDSIMNIVEPFMTRLIDNKERESYESTVRHVENNRISEVQQNKGIGGIFNRG